MQQTPNSHYRLRRRANRNRTPEILMVVLLAITFTLLGMASMLWLVRNQVAFGPTPTPTATTEAASTETPNVAATVVMEDMLTQVAYTAAQATIAFQALGASQTATAEALNASGQPQSPLGSATNVVMLPSISAGGSDDQPVDPAAQATSIAMLPIIAAPQPESPLSTPTETPLPGITVVETPIETPTEIITETPTETPTATLEPPTPTATATLLTVSNMTSRVVADGGAPLYPGIGSVYTPIVTKPKEDTSLRLNGRSETGEWLLVCCEVNVEYWTRYAFVRPQGNPTPQGAPTSAVGDDVSWLPIRSVTTNPQPTATPVQQPPGDGDYPQALHDLRNSGRVPLLPAVYSAAERLTGSEAAGPYLSPLVIANGKVYAVSGDRHLYALDKTYGNQMWKLNLGEDVRRTPAVVGSNIYLVTESGNLISVLDGGSQQWRQQMPNGALPVTAVKVVGGKILVGVNENNIQKLYVFDRNNGSFLKSREIGATMLPPAVVGNTIYAAGAKLVALDVDNIDLLLWQATPGGGIITPPVFISPGKKAIAELIFADGSGQIHVVNAHTGEEKMNFGGGQGAKFINVNDEYIAVSGDGFVRVYRRSDAGLIQNVSIPGALLSSLNNGNRLLTVFGDGQVILIDIVSGQQTPLVTRPAAMQAAPAVSGLDLYTPGSDNYLYIIRGSQ